LSIGVYNHLEQNSETTIKTNKQTNKTPTIKIKKKKKKKYPSQKRAGEWLKVKALSQKKKKDNN
jgi:hypothetical protein